MVRPLTYANHFDIEGLVDSTSRHQRNETAAWRIREIVEAYGKVQPNLTLHEVGYPSANSLLSVIREGRPDFGMNAVGDGMDSPGSDWLIDVVDRDDPRPVWGGPNVLAQALWNVRDARSAEELDEFVTRLRVYTISDQDNSGPWIRKTYSRNCSTSRVREFTPESHCQRRRIEIRHPMADHASSPSTNK